MDENLNTLLLNFSIDINRIKETFLSKYVPFVIHEDVIINHIFEELYKIPELLKYDYLKLKVIELLMLLRVVENKNGNYKNQYFYKDRTHPNDKGQRYYADFLTNEIKKHYLEENKEDENREIKKNDILKNNSLNSQNNNRNSEKTIDLRNMIKNVK